MPAVPGSPSGPSVQTHADNCSGPGLHERARFGPLDGVTDGHDVTEAIDGLQTKSLALDTVNAGDSDHGGSLAADAHYHQCPLQEADHNSNDDHLAEHGDRDEDIPSPATLGNLCEQEPLFSPISGPGIECTDASMMVAAMEPSCRLTRGKGMQDSDPCNSFEGVSDIHGSVSDSGPGPSEHLDPPAASPTDFHHADSISPGSSLPIPPPPSAPPPAGMADLDSILRPRGLQGVESGGNGHCLFTSVIASIKHAAFLPAHSPLLDLLSVSHRGCPALREKIAETFLASPYYIYYRDSLDDAAWRGYIRSIRHNGAGDERCIYAIADIFECNVHLYSARTGLAPEIYQP